MSTFITTSIAIDARDGLRFDNQYIKVVEKVPKSKLIVRKKCINIFYFIYINIYLYIFLILYFTSSNATPGLTIVFIDSALWAGSVIESPCPSVCV